MAAPDFQEKKDFIGRMVNDFESIVWPKELYFCKQIFASYDREFLSKVEPPFKMNSTAWFLGQKGKHWLTTKQREFYQTVRSSPEIIDYKEPVKETTEIEYKKTLAEFLNE